MPAPSEQGQGMNPCDECIANRLRYLDNRLQGRELDDFRAHLEVCSNCRAIVEAEQALSRVLRRSRPLYSAPAALRARVAAAVDERTASIYPRENFYERLLRIGGSRFADSAWRVT